MYINWADNWHGDYVDIGEVVFQLWYISGAVI